MAPIPKPTIPTLRDDPPGGLVRELGALDATMLVAGSMIGSGIFIVSADIVRQVGSAGWLLVAWAITGLMTVSAALCYGELAAMFPRAGGQYVFLREAYSPLWGFLYGWTLFLVIQTGTIAAVAVAFSRFLGVLVPAVSPTRWIVPPIDVSSSYALSLSTQQAVAILLVVVLTAINTRGLRLGKLIQDVFTSAKTLALVALIALGIWFGLGTGVPAANLSDLWTPRDATPIASGLALAPTVAAGAGMLGLLVALCVAQVGSLFSSDAWNNVTFVAAEVKDPKRDVPLSLLTGTLAVTVLYLLANLAYLCALPLASIQQAPDDRVGTAALGVIFGPAGAGLMAVAIIVSTFGCNNGLVLAGARVYYAMAKDGLFFRATGRLNRRHVPALALILQGIWASVLILPRTRLRDAQGALLLEPGSGAERYGNLYGALLDYVVVAVLVFYVLTIAGLFVLRRRRPDAERPYRAWGYPVLPVLYILAASVIMVVLVFYRTETTWPGLLLVMTGFPVYYLWHGRRDRASRPA